LVVDFYRPDDGIFDQAIAMGADLFETRLMVCMLPITQRWQMELDLELIQD
jgi:hypothetical protein